MSKKTLLIELIVSESIKEVFTSNEETVAELLEVGFKVNILNRL